jgi:hypothetical protein
VFLLATFSDAFAALNKAANFTLIASSVSGCIFAGDTMILILPRVISARTVRELSRKRFCATFSGHSIRYGISGDGE